MLRYNTRKDIDSNREIQSQLRNNNKTRFFRFPYIKGLTQEFKAFLTKMDSRAVFYNLNTLNQFFSRIKDTIPKELKSNVVYCIPCLDCDKEYIGQTSQHLKKRVAQHKTDCKNPGNVDKSAVTQHQFLEGHKWDFENYKVIEQENNNYRRSISEMINIRKRKTVNLKSDVRGLSIIYDTLIRRDEI